MHAIVLSQKDLAENPSFDSVGAVINRPDLDDAPYLDPLEVVFALHFKPVMIIGAAHTNFKRWKSITWSIWTVALPEAEWSSRTVFLKLDIGQNEFIRSFGYINRAYT